MDDSEIIISGSEYNGPELTGSIAEHFLPRMKSLPKDFISQVDFGTNESITNHEFLRACLEVAEGLIEFGLKKGDVIAVVCSTGIRSVITAMGSIMSGGIFAPMDPTLRAFELQHLFKQLQPKYIICEAVKAREIQRSVLAINLNTKIILIDTSDSGEFFSWNDIRTKVDVENYTPRKGTDPKKDIALICCSSGSTGMPKGIALSHFSVMLTLATMETHHVPEGNRVILFTSPLFWVSGTIMVLLSCFSSFTRYVPKSISPEDVLEAIQKCKPFFILSSPASLLFMIEHPNFKKYDLSSVKLIISAGSVLGAAAASKIKVAWKGAVITSTYGLTETCGGIMSSLGYGDMDSVGKILPEAKVKVVDLTTGQSLGPNQTGECRIKTKRLMNGYYNNEVETKATFDEKGWFRTGDLVYYNEEGFFYIVGRKKEAIAYQTYEISPAEIESFIIGLDGVKDVAVVPVPHELDGNHLRALIVKGPNSKITAQGIINGVKENFTERKHLKAGVQFVNALPRSEVGKLKRSEAQKMINIKTNEVYIDGTVG